MVTQEFKHLFTPMQIGNVTVSNRIFCTAHLPRMRPDYAEPNEKEVRYYERKAKGGIGLIITGGHYPVWPTTLNRPTAYQSDNVIPALKKMADAIHQYGTKVFAQLDHPGSGAKSGMLGGGSILSTSNIPRKDYFYPGPDIPRPMEIEDIKRATAIFAQVIARFKEAGYDGVELTAMFGKLASTFISPLTNNRTDEYGGSLENRMRFLLENVEAAREAVGPDFVLGVRLTGDEFLDGGWTLEDCKEISRILEATGKIDYLLICAGSRGPAHIPPSYYPLAPFVYLPAGVKEVVKLPVFCTGRINDPVLAERILADGQADLIGMTRATLADPDMPNKAREGRGDEIRRCVGCMEGCVGRGVGNITCALNPETGREGILVTNPAENTKKVMVIGAGAAGMEVARVAASRGHKVSIYEKEDILAKELLIASKCPGREDFEEVTRCYTRQLKQLGVDIHLGITVTAEMVLRENPDAVVVATGALPYIPDLPGANAANVVEMRQVLLGEVETGENVVIVDCQNHIYGLDTADFLVDNGKNVELLAEAVFAGNQVNGYTIEAIYTRVLAKGVVITPLTRCKEIRGDTLITANVLTGQEKEISGVDTVVFCTDGIANDSLYRELKGKVKELYQAGQCVSPRKIIDSIYDGALVGRKI